MISDTDNLSSANALYLRKSKILLCGKKKAFRWYVKFYRHFLLISFADHYEVWHTPLPLHKIVVKMKNPTDNKSDETQDMKTIH